MICLMLSLCKDSPVSCSLLRSGFKLLTSRGKSLMLQFWSLSSSSFGKTRLKLSQASVLKLIWLKLRDTMRFCVSRPSKKVESEFAPMKVVLSTTTLLMRFGSSLQASLNPLHWPKPKQYCYNRSLLPWILPIRLTDSSFWQF